MGWVGSNTNPNNNAGQGRQGSDRSNMVVLQGRNYWEDGQPEWGKTVLTPDGTNTHGHLGNSYPMHLKNGTMAGWNNKISQQLAILKDINTNGGELSELDDSSTYASFDLMQFKTVGLWNYVCTRNNNFSNRSQKGVLEVKKIGTVTTTTLVSFSGASISSGGAKLIVSSGSMVQGTIALKPLGRQNDPNGYCHPRCGSQYYELPIAPPGDTKTVLQIPYDSKADSTAVVYYTTQSSVTAPDSSWHEVDGATCSGGTCNVPVGHKAVYVVWNEFHWWVYLMSTLAICCVLAIGGGIFYKLKH